MELDETAAAPRGHSPLLEGRDTQIKSTLTRSANQSDGAVCQKQTLHTSRNSLFNSIRPNTPHTKGGAENSETPPPMIT